LWIRVFPDVPVSKKPPKSAWVRARVRRISGRARVKPGRILFELDGVPGPLAAEALSAPR
jgi:large subunit ribosomal protein L16